MSFCRRCFHGWLKELPDVPTHKKKSIQLKELGLGTSTYSHVRKWGEAVGFKRPPLRYIPILSLFLKLAWVTLCKFSPHLLHGLWRIKGKGQDTLTQYEQIFFFLYIFFLWAPTPYLLLRMKVYTHHHPPTSATIILVFTCLSCPNWERCGKKIIKKKLLAFWAHQTLLVLFINSKLTLKVNTNTILWAILRSGDDRWWASWALWPRLHLSVCSGGHQQHNAHHSYPNTYESLLAWVWVCTAVNVSPVTPVSTSHTSARCLGVHFVQASHEIKLY